MILLKSIKVKNKGSKISKTRAREGGVSVFPFFLFPKATAPANRAIQQAGKKEGGWGEGIFARLLRKRNPAALLVQSRVPQKSFLFLLEEKEIVRQIKKCEENFFAGWRASASGGGAERQSSQSGFSSKKVRILTKRHRQFSDCDFWAIPASPRQRRGSASARILNGFLKSQNNFCPLKRKFAVRGTDKMKFYKPIFFSFAKGERQSDNLILTAQII